MAIVAFLQSVGAAPWQIGPMTPPILNLDALDLQPWGHGVAMPGAGRASDRYRARIGFVSRRLGAKKLGYNLIVLLRQGE